MMNAFTFAIALVAQTAAAPAPAMPIDTARVSAAVRAETERTRAPGAAIGIILDGRVVYANGFGNASAEHPSAIDTGTLFRVGSVTKVMTALAVLAAEGHGKVTLDQPISKYMPGLHPRLGALTLRALLTHRAGMIALPSANGPGDEDALRRRVLAWNDSVLFAQPGEAYSYSSPGYWLAAAVLEQAEGASYAHLVQRHVFEPLGMRASAFDPLTAFTRPLALDHRRGAQGAPAVVRPYPNDASTWPGGSAFSSVHDLSRLALALLDRGRIDGVQALPEPAVAAVLRRQTDNPAGSCGYTFGLGICVAGADTLVSHYGFRSGSGAVFTLVPTRRAAVIILANIGGGIFFQTERAILDMLGVARESSQAPVLRDIAVDEFERLAGKYVAGSDTVHIYAEQGRLVLRAYTPDARPLRMGAAHELFVVDAEGRPQGRFVLLQSAQGNWFLSDGLNSFRRLTAAPRR